MNIGIIVAVILVPSCVMAIFSVVSKSNNKISKKMSDDYFVVSLPNFCLVLGIVDQIVSVILLLAFTLFSEELPHIILYVIVVLFFICPGIYLSLKTLKCRVIVKGDEITVYSIFGKPYTFTFNEIVSAVRQVKKNQVKSERIVTRTKSGKKMIVESAEISYKRFKKILCLKVDSEKLTGF